MMRLFILLSSGLFLCVGSYAQEGSDIDAIMNYLGVGSPEELDQYEVERLQDILSDPVRMNLSDASELMSSGLFSRYQVASFIDYRSRHGDVLSYAELAALDGFGEDFVACLRPFVSLASFRQAGHSSDTGKVVFSDLAQRAAVRRSDVTEYSYGIKYRVDVADRLHLSLATSRPYGDPENSSYSGSLCWEVPRLRGKIVIGDFNARFGQGLVLWNGMFLTSLNSPSAFMKKPSGISRSWSYTGSSALTGLAAQIGAGGFTLSSTVILQGIKEGGVSGTVPVPCLNLTRQGRYGHCAMTHVAEAEHGKTSVDAAFCLSGVNVFGEAAYDWSQRGLSVVAGSEFRTGEMMRMAVLMRYLHDELHGIAFSGAGGWGSIEDGTFSVDMVYYPQTKDKNVSHSVQLKSQVQGSLRVSDALLLKLRISERVRTWGHRFRTDCRTDIVYESGPYLCTMRLNALSCDGWGFVTYVEGGYRPEKLGLYLRQGFFCVDDWDDRIYVYERDAPGSFTVPAMYGRGLWTSLAASWRFTPSARLYARAAYTAYPFMSDEKKKPGKAELKLQMVFKF